MTKIKSIEGAVFHKNLKAIPSSQGKHSNRWAPVRETEEWKQAFVNLESVNGKLGVQEALEVYILPETRKSLKGRDDKPLKNIDQSLFLNMQAEVARREWSSLRVCKRKSTDGFYHVWVVDKRTEIELGGRKNGRRR